MQNLFGLLKPKSLLGEEGIVLSLIPPGGGLTGRGFRKVDSAEVVRGTPVLFLYSSIANHLLLFQFGELKRRGHNIS